MNVHIVCEVKDPTHVLSRMARTLADGTGWSLGAEADPAADVNYFMPYLSYKPVGTKTAAYFTHLEEADRSKADRWRAVDQMVDGRFVTAGQYLAHLRGHRATARPPLDFAKFCPDGRRPRSAPRAIGVAGMVYRTGRKGDHLVQMLKASSLGRSARLIASGRGWSIPTTRHEWAQMQDFYRSLDVFLCTSLIEGVPYPPLEALACGVPAVVPIGVGLLDDLPEFGVYRYEAGDYDGMVAALRAALDEPRWREAEQRSRLPFSVSQYTPAAWCADHVAALERWFTSPPSPLSTT